MFQGRTKRQTTGASTTSSENMAVASVQEAFSSDAVSIVSKMQKSVPDQSAENSGQTKIAHDNEGIVHFLTNEYGSHVGYTANKLLAKQRWKGATSKVRFNAQVSGAFKHALVSKAKLDQNWGRVRDKLFDTKRHKEMFGQVLQMAVKAERVFSIPCEERTESDISTLYSTIKENPYFASRSTKATRELCRVISKNRFRSGEAVFHAGDEADCFYIIFSGSVAVYLPGLADPIRSMNTGEAFGEVALMSSKQNRTGTVICSETTELLVVPRDDYRRLIASLNENSDEDSSAWKAKFMVCVDVFRHVSLLDLEKMGDAIEVLTLRQGEELFHQGQDAEYIYVVKSGAVRQSLRHGEWPWGIDPFDCGMPIKRQKQLYLKNLGGLHKNSVYQNDAAVEKRDPLKPYAPHEQVQPSKVKLRDKSLVIGYAIEGEVCGEESATKIKSERLPHTSSAIVISEGAEVLRISIDDIDDGVDSVAKSQLKIRCRRRVAYRTRNATEASEFYERYWKHGATLMLQGDDKIVWDAASDMYRELTQHEETTFRPRKTVRQSVAESLVSNRKCYSKSNGVPMAVPGTHIKLHFNQFKIDRQKQEQAGQFTAGAKFDPYRQVEATKNSVIVDAEKSLQAKQKEIKDTTWHNKQSEILGFDPDDELGIKPEEWLIFDADHSDVTSIAPQKNPTSSDGMTILKPQTEIAHMFDDEIKMVRSKEQTEAKAKRLMSAAKTAIRWMTMSHNYDHDGNTDRGVFGERQTSTAATSTPLAPGEESSTSEGTAIVQVLKPPGLTKRQLSLGMIQTMNSQEQTEPRVISPSAQIMESYDDDSSQRNADSVNGHSISMDGQSYQDLVLAENNDHHADASNQFQMDNDHAQNDELPNHSMQENEADYLQLRAEANMNISKRLQARRQSSMYMKGNVNYVMHLGKSKQPVIAKEINFLGRQHSIESGLRDDPTPRNQESSAIQKNQTAVTANSMIHKAEERVADANAQLLHLTEDQVNMLDSKMERSPGQSDFDEDLDSPEILQKHLGPGAMQGAVSRWVGHALTKDSDAAALTAAIHARHGSAHAKSSGQLRKREKMSAKSNSSRSVGSNKQINASSQSIKPAEVRPSTVSTLLGIPDPMTAMGVSTSTMPKSAPSSQGDQDHRKYRKGKTRNRSSQSSLTAAVPKLRLHEALLTVSSDLVEGEKALFASQENFEKQEDWGLRAFVTERMQELKKCERFLTERQTNDQRPPATVMPSTSRIRTAPTAPQGIQAQEFAHRGRSLRVQTAGERMSSARQQFDPSSKASSQEGSVALSLLPVSSPKEADLAKYHAMYSNAKELHVAEHGSAIHEENERHTTGQSLLLPGSEHAERHANILKRRKQIVVSMGEKAWVDCSAARGTVPSEEPNFKSMYQFASAHGRVSARNDWREGSILETRGGLDPFLAITERSLKEGEETHRNSRTPGDTVQHSAQLHGNFHAGDFGLSPRKKYHSSQEQILSDWLTFATKDQDPRFAVPIMPNKPKSRPNSSSTIYRASVAASRAKSRNSSKNSNLQNVTNGIDIQGVRATHTKRPSTTTHRPRHSQPSHDHISRNLPTGDWQRAHLTSANLQAQIDSEK